MGEGCPLCLVLLALAFPAVAVALRTSSPVMVSREVLDEVGISLAGQGDEEVEAFREFLDNVSPDDFLGEGGPAEEPGGASS